MEQPKDYIALNKDSWNRRTEYHVKSEFYDMDNFLNGSSSLNPFELALLGDLNGKSVLHLQCHFGQDSISLSRMGANVVGVDLSDKAIDTAKQIALQTNSSAQFICCDIYDLPQHLDQQFDMVFTSYGTIGWLPDLNKWAGIISKYLKPGGQFVFVEFHPVVWMFDNDFEKVGYNYFNTGALIETETGTYADREADLEQEYVCWNHSLSEVMGSLIQNDLTIRSFEEYDYSPYNCFRHTIEFEPKKYRIAHLDNKIPMVYSLVATK
ncbi:methyltransferase family protein [Sphingobacterium alimentarium]|uniref:Methyltransferase family protein n=1 Tax=Sphingobacterium alimentarium TaxID=797292 RepID=A0A4R3VT72_9SPHI|nr:class I SAM-dependent methyltransferase [Sphingobacterium alimentarium]TCV13689.1 methyltransferase family protein [Sphingobacterium alimentarium]